MLLANRVVSCLFFPEFQWCLESVDCFASGVPSVSYECQIVTTFNVLGASCCMLACRSLGVG